MHEQITSLDVDLKAYKAVDAAAASKPGDSSRSGSKYGPGDKYKSASWHPGSWRYYTTCLHN
jgi:hypothetical protein